MKRSVIMFIGLVTVAVAWPNAPAIAVECTPKQQEKTDQWNMVYALEDAIKGHNAKKQKEIDGYVTHDVYVERGDGSPPTTTREEYAKHNKHDWERFEGHNVKNCRVSDINVSGDSATLHT
ncbi:MAG: hypothetical protein ACREJU_07070, partial [Nitrospiraceae bacterium]